MSSAFLHLLQEDAHCSSGGDVDVMCRVVTGLAS